MKKLLFILISSIGYCLKLFFVILCLIINLNYTYATVTLKDLYKPCENFKNSEINLQRDIEIINNKIAFLNNNPNYQAEKKPWTKIKQFKDYIDTFDKTNINYYMNKFKNYQDRIDSILISYYGYLKNNDRIAFCYNWQIENRSINSTQDSLFLIAVKKSKDNQIFSEALKSNLVNYILEKFNNPLAVAEIAKYFEKGLPPTIIQDKSKAIQIYKKMLSNEMLEYIALAHLYELDYKNSSKYRNMFRDKFPKICLELEKRLQIKSLSKIDKIMSNSDKLFFKICIN